MVVANDIKQLNKLQDEAGMCGCGNVHGSLLLLSRIRTRSHSQQTHQFVSGTASIWVGCVCCTCRMRSGMCLGYREWQADCGQLSLGVLISCHSSHHSAAAVHKVTTSCTMYSCVASDYPLSKSFPSSQFASFPHVPRAAGSCYNELRYNHNAA